MKTTRILILEDDLKTLSILFNKISKLEEELINKNYSDIAVTVLSEYTQVEDYINKIEIPNFDIILLDRDCKAGGSFHVLDLSKFDKNKIISISSVPEYNEHAKKLGINKAVWKDYDNLEKFSLAVIRSVEEILPTNLHNL